MLQDETSLAGCMMGLIGARLFGRPLSSSLCESLTPERQRELYILAKSHDLAHIVGEALTEAGLLTEKEIAGKFSRQSYLAVFRYERIKYELAALRELFGREKVAFMPLKGSVLRDYYPDPALRTSCDIDILVKPEERERAAELLVGQLNYRREGEGSHDISFFAPSDLHVELHFDLIDDHEVRAKALGDPWENAAPKEEGGYEYEMTGAYFYAYNLAHTAKHFCGGGCGVRPFIDLLIMDRFMPFDRPAAEALFIEQNLTVFHAEAEKLAAYWFLGGEGDELTAEMEGYLLQGGVYGRIDAVVAADVGKKGRKRFLLGKIFLPFDGLKLQYPVLKKLPVLYPFCQIARWFAILFRRERRKAAAAQVKTSRRVEGGEAERIAGLQHRLGID